MSRGTYVQPAPVFMPVKGLLWYVPARGDFCLRGFDLFGRKCASSVPFVAADGDLLTRVARACSVTYCGISAAPQQVQMYQPECGSRSHSRLSMGAWQFQQWLMYHTLKQLTHSRSE